MSSVGEWCSYEISLADCVSCFFRINWSGSIICLKVIWSLFFFYSCQSWVEYLVSTIPSYLGISLPIECKMQQYEKYLWDVCLRYNLKQELVLYSNLWTLVIYLDVSSSSLLIITIGACMLHSVKFDYGDWEFKIKPFQSRWGCSTLFCNFIPCIFSIQVP